MASLPRVTCESTSRLLDTCWVCPSEEIRCDSEARSYSNGLARGSATSNLLSADFVPWSRRAGEQGISTHSHHGRSSRLYVASPVCGCGRLCPRSDRLSFDVDGPGDHAPACHHQPSFASSRHQYH
jgi:hypothetical protein